MGPLEIGGFGILALFALMLGPIPIGFAMIIVGVAGFALQSGWRPAVTLLVNEPIGILSSADLATVPLFLLMGTFASVAGLLDRSLQSCSGLSRPPPRRSSLRDDRRQRRIWRRLRFIHRDGGDVCQGRAARNAQARLFGGLLHRHHRGGRHAEIADSAVDRDHPLLHRVEGVHPRSVSGCHPARRGRRAGQPACHCGDGAARTEVCAGGPARAVG